jgi:hypothetical protein
MGWCAKGSGTKTAEPTLDAAHHAIEDQAPIPVAGHDPSRAGTSVASLSAGVRGAPTRHRAGFSRSIPRDPLFDPAGPRALHRRGGRGAPCPRRHARARHSTGARRQPRAGPQRESRRRSLPRSSADDAEADAHEHGLRASQLSKASPGTRGRGPTKLGATFFGMAPAPGGPDRPSGRGSPHDLDGRHRLEAGGRLVAGPRTSGFPAPRAPDLIPRMLHRRRSLQDHRSVKPPQFSEDVTGAASRELADFGSTIWASAVVVRQLRIVMLL